MATGPSGKPPRGPFVLSPDDYAAVVSAILSFRQFGAEMLSIFSEDVGEEHPAAQGALRMVATADRVLQLLGYEGDVDA